MLTSNFLRYIGFMAVLLVAVAAPIRADSVSLYAAVEKDGVLLSGLTENNFRLYEDGELRPFRLEEPETPATIAVLVEYSRNSWLYYNDILRAMEGFFSKAPDGNWYALATFSNTLNVRVDFTKLRGKIASSFADLPAPLWSEVNTYDAVYEMLEKMDRLPGRRVLIIIGSGADTFSELTLQDVQRKAERANVVIYAAGAGSQLRGQYESYLDNVTRLNLLQAESFLRTLAEKTGGEAWFPRFETGFADVMEGIMQTLAHQYRLVYESRIPDDGKFHKIKLEAFQVIEDQRNDFRVRVRDGWRS